MTSTARSLGLAEYRAVCLGDFQRKEELIGLALISLRSTVESNPFTSDAIFISIYRVFRAQH